MKKYFDKNMEDIEDSNLLSKVISKVPILYSIRIISILSIVSAIILLTSSSILYNNVLTHQRLMKDLKTKFDKVSIDNHNDEVLKQFFLHRLTPKEDLEIFGGQRMKYDRPFTKWHFLEEAVCRKFERSSGYLFYSLSSIILCIFQMSLAIWSGVSSFQKLEVNIIFSVWISRALHSYLILIPLYLLILLGSTNYRDSELQWIESMELEVTRWSYSRVTSFKCDKDLKSSFLIIQIVNLVVLSVIGLLTILSSFSNPGSCSNHQFKMYTGHDMAMHHHNSFKTLDKLEKEENKLDEIFRRPSDMSMKIGKKSESFFSGVLVSGNDRDEKPLFDQGCKRRLSYVKNFD